MNTTKNTKLIEMVNEYKNIIENFHSLLKKYDTILNHTLERKSFFELLLKRTEDLSEKIEQVYQEVQNSPEDPNIFWLYVDNEHLRLNLADTVNFYSKELSPSIEVRTFFIELRDIYQNLIKHDQDVFKLFFSYLNDNDLEVA